MSCFPAKLMAVVVAVFILMGDFPARSALLPHGGRKSLSLALADGTRDGLRKKVGRKDGSFGSESLDINSKKLAAFRSLRASSSPPPAPLRNKNTAMVTPIVPPPQIS